MLLVLQAHQARRGRLVLVLLARLDQAARQELQEQVLLALAVRVALVVLLVLLVLMLQGLLALAGQRGLERQAQQGLRDRQVHQDRADLQV